MQGSFRLFLLASHAGSAAAVCLTNGIPASQRKDSETLWSNGTSVRFSLIIGDWESSALLSTMLKILIEEKLGYHVDTYKYGSSGEAWARVSGCVPGVGGGWVCDATKLNPAMMAVEVWYRGSQTWEDYGMPPGTKDMDPQYIMSLGNPGYFGREGMAISAYTTQQSTSPCTLEFYKMLQYPKSPWESFDPLSNVYTDNLKLCSETQLTSDNSIMTDYLSMNNPDTFGVITQAGKPIGKCWNSAGAVVAGTVGNWWIAPSCRSNISQCIPLISDGNGWGFKWFVQQAKHWDLPVALAAAKDQKFNSLVGQPNKSLMYTYTTASQVHGQTLITFPTYNMREWTKLNIYVSDARNDVLDKIGWVGLSTYFTKIVILAQRLSVDYDTLVLWLRDWENSTLPTATWDQRLAKAYNLTCQWLKNNDHQWKDFVPKPKDCANAQGVVDQNGNFVTNVSLGTGCNTCPAGRFSMKVKDPDYVLYDNYICEACAVGKFLPYDALDEHNKGVCLPCDQGKFASSTGTSECELCPKGRFGGQKGATKCPQCSEGTFAFERNSKECGKCGPGQYRPNYTASWIANWDSNVKYNDTVGSLQGVNNDENTYYAMLGVSCLECPIAEYQKEYGKTACQHCDYGYITPARGAEASTECECPAGSYANHKNTGFCDKCPASDKGLICPGGHRQAVNITLDQTVMIGDGYMALAGTLNVYVCEPKKRCKGSRSPVDAGVKMCTFGATTPGCTYCESGMYISGDTCEDCDELFFPAWVIALIIWCLVVQAGYGLYYSSMFPPNPVSGCYGPIVGLMQCVSLTLDQAVPVSKNLQAFLGGLAALRVDLSVFGFPKECLFTNNPVPLYLERVIWPILLILAFAAVWGSVNGFSTLVNKIKGKALTSPIELLSEKGFLMRRFNVANEASKKTVSGIPLSTRAKWFWTAKLDDILNVLNKTAHSLFISLANCGIFIYITTPQPGGDKSLKLLPEVLFGEGVWWSLFPLSLFGLLVYNVGYMSYVAHTVFAAPRTSPVNFSFCKRNRGLWAKYDPESWWFCIPILFFGLCINLTALIENGRYQVLLGVIFVSLYIGSVSTFKPYKFKLNHNADLACKFGYLVVLLTNSLVVTEDPLAPTTVEWIVVVVTLLPVGIVFFFAIQFLWYQRVAKRQALQKRVEFAFRFMDTVAIVGHWNTKELRQMCFGLLDNDLTVLSDALDLLSYKLLHFQPYDSLKRYNFMPNPAKPNFTVPFKKLRPGYLEGIVELRGLPQDTRPLVRDLRERILRVAEDRKPSTGSPRAEGEGSPRSHNLFGHGGKKVEKKGLLFMGLPHADKVLTCMNSLFAENEAGDMDVNLEDFSRRVRAILGPDCYDDKTLEELFNGMDLQGAPGVEAQLDQYELAVQLSVEEPLSVQELDEASLSQVKRPSEIHQENEAMFGKLNKDRQRRTQASMLLCKSAIDNHRSDGAIEVPVNDTVPKKDENVWPKVLNDVTEM